jgi:hypothetical protein
LAHMAGGCAGFGDGEARPQEAGWRVLSSDPSAQVLDIAVIIGSGCRRLHDVQVSEGPDHVAITATVLQEHDTCTADCNEERVSVTLRAPLGSRAIEEPERLARRC